MAPKAAAIYARISKDIDGTGLGVSRQRDDCLRLAKRHGWSVVEVYIDNDVTAFSGKARPAYRRLLQDIRDERVQAVVAWHLDRLHRRPIELEEFIDLCDRHSVDLATVHGEVDLGTSSGRLHARLMGAVARHESEQKSDRLRRKMLELAQQGKHKGGTRPFGYEVDGVTLKQDEATLVREAGRRIIAGESLYSVCLDFNRRSIPTIRGGPWSPITLKRILTAPRIIGLREHHGEVIGSAQWPAILKLKDGERLRAILNDPRRRRGAPPRRYLLASLLRCSRCGERLSGRPNAGIRSYECAIRVTGSGCGRIGIRAEFVERMVVEAVLLRLDTPMMAQRLASTTSDSGQRRLLRSLEADRRLLEDLARAYADRKVSLAEWLAARGPIEERIEQTGKRLAHHDPVARMVSKGTVRTRWTRLSFDQ